MFFVGLPFGLGCIQAAIGCAQVERIDDLIAGKCRVFHYYQEKLAHLPLQMNPEPGGTVNGYWVPSILANEGVKFDREVLLALFKENNIDGRVLFWPLSIMPMFEVNPENTTSYYIF
jgi:perosamine synthetase